MTIDIKDISEKDRNSVLHPFTQLKDFATGKLGEPTIVETGKGIRIQDAHGNQLIDGFAGLYCVNVGYGRAEVAEAISRQAYRLAYYHSYAAHTTDQLAILSDRLVRTAPGKMSKVFYGMSGSDANETQAKLVWYYNNLRGKPSRRRSSRVSAAITAAASSPARWTGMSFYHDHMDLPLPQIVHTGAPHHYWGANPGETQREFSARRAAELDQLIERLGPDNVGAFIAEPVLGTGGITPPPEGYWKAIQAVLKKHDVLLIADEVITGFGRTGSMFGSQHYGIEPDLITVAKGLTSAYFPLSAAIVGEKVYKLMEDGADRVGAFSHGYTYSGHPIGAAAANAVLDLVEKEDLPGNARDVGAFFQAQLKEKFAQLSIVGEVRGVGLMGAIEFVADRDNRKRFDPALKVGARISKAARDRGLIAGAMPHGDILGFAPPLVTTKSEVEEIVAIAESAVRSVMDELVRDSQKI
ncbi:aminotransferase class III-fold pyridoxal phosphate-dependent enzyme [Mesorhizobium sp. M0854]|uniref:aminotransferase class III-fold pyridoxal phosphate-dependent enzyme n=1 Tax=Mesorhizobium sp. M0854 TaxID=2957013 RepID=UPI003337CDE8